MNFTDKTDPLIRKSATTTITRNLYDFSEGTNNVYETVAIISKRSNQITTEVKDQIKKMLDEFGTKTDNLEEVNENKEQIDVSKHFERLPKPTLIATEEYLEHKLYWRRPDQEQPMDDFAENNDYNK